MVCDLLSCMKKDSLAKGDQILAVSPYRRSAIQVLSTRIDARPIKIKCRVSSAQTGFKNVHHIDNLRTRYKLKRVDNRVKHDVRKVRWKIYGHVESCCCCYCFSHSAYWLPTRKKTLYTRDLERKKQRRRGRPAWRAARAHARVVRLTARAAACSKELVVATWNVRTMSERGTNGPGHAEDLLMFAAKYECDFITIQETRRDGRTTIQGPAAGYVMHCSGHCGGDGGKPGILGVGLAVRESIARALGPDGIVPEHISARLLKVRVIFKHRATTTFIVAYAPTETAATCHKSKFWKELRSTVAEVPTSDHLILMMDANARTGGRGEGGGVGDVQVLGPYGRDTLNDNGSRLLACAAEYKLSIVNTFFSTPKRGGNSDAFTYEGPKESYRWHVDYILVRQHDRRFVRNITVHPKMKSDHRLVSASIRFLRRNAPNRRRRPEEEHHGVPFDRKLLTSDQCWRATVAQEIVTKLPDSTFVAGIPDTNSMPSTFADILRQTAADTLPRRPKRPSSRGFSESPQAQARLRQAWDVRERVCEKPRARPQDPSLRKVLKVTDKAFKRAKHAGLQSFLREHTARTADLPRQRDQAGLYQHIKSLELEGKRGWKSTYIKNASGMLLREKPSILLRWKEWSQELLNAKSSTLDASILDGSSCPNTPRLRPSPRWRK